VEPLGRGHFTVLLELSYKRVFAIIRHDAHNIRKHAKVVGLPRRIAARDHDSNVRIATSDSPDCLPRALICRCRDRTGVDHQQIGIFGRRRFGAASEQLLFNRKGIGLVDPAAKRDD
jgi:hypothetical protein